MNEKLNIEDELTMLIIQLQEEREKLVETIQALNAEIQRLDRLATY
jgi:hypothetical protein